METVHDDGRAQSAEASTPAVAAAPARPGGTTAGEGDDDIITQLEAVLDEAQVQAGVLAEDLHQEASMASTSGAVTENESGAEDAGGGGPTCTPTRPSALSRIDIEQMADQQIEEEVERLLAEVSAEDGALGRRDPADQQHINASAQPQQYQQRGGGDAPTVESAAAASSEVLASGSQERSTIINGDATASADRPGRTATQPAVSLAELDADLAQIAAGGAGSSAGADDGGAGRAGAHPDSSDLTSSDIESELDAMLAATHAIPDASAPGLETLSDETSEKNGAPDAAQAQTPPSAMTVKPAVKPAMKPQEVAPVTAAAAEDVVVTLAAKPGGSKQASKPGDGADQVRGSASNSDSPGSDADVLADEADHGMTPAHGGRDASDLSSRSAGVAVAADVATSSAIPADHPVGKDSNNVSARHSQMGAQTTSTGAGIKPASPASSASSSSTAKTSGNKADGEYPGNSIHSAGDQTPPESGQHDSGYAPAEAGTGSETGLKKYKRGIAVAGDNRPKRIDDKQSTSGGRGGSRFKAGNALRMGARAGGGCVAVILTVPRLVRSIPGLNRLDVITLQTLARLNRPWQRLSREVKIILNTAAISSLLFFFSACLIVLYRHFFG